eukprot:CAMPEP_0201876170 /NCGR_PEP_ID=MMETSP0902-20130614/7928_1 /ASSEMBLY_ACC=CAM_ASM_000551 /TAXON_ID=420261 /ORGANISM="Thalassiosira antarctica, Strain CCMP982" /LENGTH=293 /DNA_ID=CAMNT_0048403361 /DNA_START=22 /DNA_END=900 /DNA_ORIENTATION=-
MTMASAARGSLLSLRRVCQGGGGVLGNASVFSEGILSGRGVATPTLRALPVPLFTINADVDVSRCFSSAPEGRKSMLRMHAVSLYQANYDDEENDAEWKDEAQPEGKQTFLDPRDGRKAEEEEEATWWLYDGTQESRDALEAMREKEAQKKRWIQNARPPVRVSEIDERGRAYGRGSRKTAQARVWVQPGEGEIVVNRKDFITYFPRESDRDHVLGPFVASQTCGKFDVTAMVQGGGLTGQAGAIRLGLARALEKYNPDYRPPMKRHGFMTRDARMVERKKVGKVKARKSPQW